MMAGSRELPNHADLLPCTHAVAGHEGTLSDANGELFIKPCVQQEIDFYEKAFRDHPDFAALMPVFLGTLSLNDTAGADSLDEQLPTVSKSMSAELKEEVISLAKSAAADEAADATADSEPGPSESGENIQWKPNKSRKIPTAKSVVLENSTYGFKKPNILDAKLGRRLWADDAPLEKRQRFDEISKITTNGSHGFRIAGMRVYRGSNNPEELDSEGYKVYGKDYGKFQVNKDNIVQAISKFIFNPDAGIDEDLGRAVAEAFLHDLRRVERVLAKSETRMYSASLLFTFEGDGEALRAAIEQRNALVSESEEEDKGAADTIHLGVAPSAVDGETVSKDPALNVQDVSVPIEGDVKVLELVGSGAAPDGEEEDDDGFSKLPPVYSLKLIDFAHAEWVPGQGPDENSLFGVQSLIKIFEELAK